MRTVILSTVLLAFVFGVVGCGSNAATTPDKIPPMPKGDKLGVKPDTGGTADEK